MFVLSILGTILFFILGYRFPRKMGWAAVMALPLLGPIAFSLVPDKTLNLTVNRIAFAIALGMLAGELQNGFRLRKLFKDKLFATALLFAVIIVIKSLGDQPAKALFIFLPNILAPLLIGYLLIREKSDLERMADIFAWQTAIISFFTFVEFFTHFNIGVWLALLNPNVDLNFTAVIYRSGLFRPQGLYANAVQTATLLSFGLPIVIWYSTKRKGLGLFFVFLTLGALLLSQSRAAYLAMVFIGLLLLLKFIKKTTLILPMAFVLALLMIVVIPKFSIFMGGFYENTIIGTIKNSDPELKVSTKFDRIPKFWAGFLEKPLFGYTGYPDNTYNDVMDSDDIPSPFMYALVGGIVLFLIYMKMIFGIPYRAFRLCITKSRPKKDGDFLYYLFTGFSAAVFMEMTNWIVAHWPVMFMMSVAIFKVYILPALPPGQRIRKQRRRLVWTTRRSW
jgi:hypothetical protein